MEMTQTDTAASAPPLVLFEAEATAGGKYDSWQDTTGEQYHFPNQYRKRVNSGRRFVYYRGMRRTAGGRGRAEYFGHGRIGSVWLDESSAHQPRKSRWAWFCSILDYVEFPRPVAAKQNGKYIEDIAHSRGWQVGVRLLMEDAYHEILGLAGLPAHPQPPSHPATTVALRASKASYTSTTQSLRPLVRHH
jgi:hypothetical protein